MRHETLDFNEFDQKKNDVGGRQSRVRLISIDLTTCARVRFISNSVLRLDFLVDTDCSNSRQVIDAPATQQVLESIAHEE